jgi:predicted alpha/beta-hydrolase family hydrolase
VGLVLAHGAGGNLQTASLAATAEGLARRGFPVLRFNFPYRQSGRRIPDPAPVLEECYRAVAAKARESFAPARMFLGGRSMGGRIASQIAAQSPPAGLAGLVFLAYPLHPPGKPERLRDAHLGAIQVPMLFVSGTRDTFARRDLLESVLGRLPLARIHWIEGADHSFRVPRRSPAEVNEEVLDVLEDFLGAQK